MMSERQVFVWSALEFKPGKRVLDPRIEAAVVWYHNDDETALIQDFFCAIDRRQRIPGVLQNVQHRNDVILAIERDIFNCPVMDWNANLSRQDFGDVFR